ncbi:uncharacterized protein LOC132039076 [Lycium ferocissimum]|uniref:uncharacterized protein LOC132039076 n=1 Tax=Lycium ferocissimum TaxID=112874 RepID=UPI002815B375|nr:uncharacterized protein LOC132039076 [Lycium ferocissimum]
MPTGKLAKWQMPLSELDIVYVSQKEVKGQALADLLAKNPVDEEYEPLRTYFLNEEILFVGEDIIESYPGWRLSFDGVVNFKGSEIGAVLVSHSAQYYPVAAKLRFKHTNNIAEYEACILGLKLALDMNIQELLVIGDSDLLIHQVQGKWATKNAKILPYLHLIQRLCKNFRKIEFKHTPRVQNEFANAFATISSMIQHPERSYIDPLEISLKEQHAYCSHMEAEPNRMPWYADVKNYLEIRKYPKYATSNQKKTIQRMAKTFFLNREILYRRTSNLGLLRRVDAGEATRLLDEVHAGVCGPHMNGFTLARKIVRAGYFWMTMESECSQFVQKCHQCQIHGDLIRVPPRELNVMSSPWPFAAWGMDVIGLIEPAASNRHRFILVAIDYFTKWVEVASYKSVTKKVVATLFATTYYVNLGFQNPS